ncbi:MAG: response regulator [Methanomicrobiales archaeon]|nr:response regulator [Methanomicrobiales archaeon]
MNEKTENSAYHILLVEDNRTQAEYLRRLLEKKEHIVTVCSNGYDALNKVREDKPDIILTDIMMPDMDGFSLCKKLKQEKTTSKIPVILVTHLYSPIDVIKGLEAGADNFIIKPYDPESIYSRINSIMLLKNHISDEVNKPLDVVFSHEIHTISSSRMQILNILLSTYETAVKNNSELQVAHERLHYTNAQLQKVVDDLVHTNESLHLKNLERGRLESSLAAAHNKLMVITEVIRQVLDYRIHPAYHSICSEKQKKNLGKKGLTDENPCLLLNTSIQTMRNARMFLQCGDETKKWQGIHNLIDSVIKSFQGKPICYENLIPEDVEVLTDKRLELALSCIISFYRQMGEELHKWRFSFQITDNRKSLIVEYDEEHTAKENSYDMQSRRKDPGSDPDLFMVKNILSDSGFEISGNEISDKTMFLEIICRDGLIRFSSNTL